MSAISQVSFSNSWLFSVCVACGGEVGTYFLLVTFLSLEAVCVYACVCCGGAVQSNVKHIVLYCWCVRSALSFPHVSQSSPPAQHTHHSPTHPSLLTGRAHSGNRRSPNPSVTLRPVGSGLSIVALLWAAAQPLSILLSCLISHFVYWCIWSHFGPFP